MWLDHTRHKHLGLFDHRSEEASRAKIGCGLIKRTVNQQTTLPNYRNMKLIGLVRLLEPNASQTVTEHWIGTLPSTKAGVSRITKRTVNQQTILPNRNMKLVGLVSALTQTECLAKCDRVSDRDSSFNRGRCPEREEVQIRKVCRTSSCRISPFSYNSIVNKDYCIETL